MVYYNLVRGDSLKALRELADDPKEKGKYRAIITSPPYYGHRHYGRNDEEVGQEKTDQQFLDRLTEIFDVCRELLTEDGSLWIVIGDTRRNNHKLMIPHRLALQLTAKGYTFREDVIWYKKNNVSSSANQNLAQAYEFILFLSKNPKSFTNLDLIRVKGNEAREGRNKIPPRHLLQYRPINPNKKRIAQLEEVIHSASYDTPFTALPTTSEISIAYGYDPEKYCPTCFRKFKRHATRKRVGDHKHYPIFAVCNPGGKNPGNVWEISTKAHYGNEHFAIFPEDLVARIVNFASQEGDWILDPFMGRGTTGIVCAVTGRNFRGIDLYEQNVKTAEKNIMDAMKGKYDTKLIDVVARETNLIESTAPKITLETYLLADGSLSTE